MIPSIPLNPCPPLNTHWTRFLTTFPIFISHFIQTCHHLTYLPFIPIISHVHADQSAWPLLSPHIHNHHTHLSSPHTHHHFISIPVNPRSIHYHLHLVTLPTFTVHHTSFSLIHSLPIPCECSSCMWLLSIPPKASNKPILLLYFQYPFHQPFPIPIILMTPPILAHYYLHCCRWCFLDQRQTSNHEAIGRYKNQVHGFMGMVKLWAHVAFQFLALGCWTLCKEKNEGRLSSEANVQSDWRSSLGEWHMF